jgi:hypothetical protein
MPADDREKERLQSLHLALDAALEQLGYALQAAVLGDGLTASTEEARTIERLVGECAQVRNQVRERLMRALAKPTLNIIK